MSKQAAAEGRSRLNESAFIVKAQIHSVSRKTGAQSTHYTWSKISSLRSSREYEYRWFILCGNICDNLLIRSAAVALKVFIFSNYNLVCTVCNKCICKLGNIAANEQCRYFLAGGLLKLKGFADKLKGCFIQHTVFLFGEHPNAVCFVFSHGCSSFQIRCWASSISTNCLAISAFSPEKMTVSIFSRFGSKSRLVTEGEPGMPHFAGSAPKSS